MAGQIHVDHEALNSLRQALETAGQEYKTNLAKLTSLIDEMTSGDIQGNPATDLLNKFRAKEQTFKELEKTIDEAEGYVQQETTKFTNMISDLESSMR